MTPKINERLLHRPRRQHAVDHGADGQRRRRRPGHGTATRNWYTAYHGYWPRDLDDHRVALRHHGRSKALVDAAHTKSIKVLFDYAMNHVHQDSPIYQAHTNDGWFSPLMQNGESCVCGTAGDACNYDGTLGKSLLVRALPARLELQQRRRRARYSVDNALMWIKTTARRLPPRRDQAHRAGRGSPTCAPRC